MVIGSLIVVVRQAKNVVDSGWTVGVGGGRCTQRLLTNLDDDVGGGTCVV